MNRLVKEIKINFHASRWNTFWGRTTNKFYFFYQFLSCFFNSTALRSGALQVWSIKTKAVAFPSITLRPWSIGKCISSIKSISWGTKAVTKEGYYSWRAIFRRSFVSGIRYHQLSHFFQRFTTFRGVWLIQPCNSPIYPYQSKRLLIPAPCR